MTRPPLPSLLRCSVARGVVLGLALLGGGPARADAPRRITVVAPTDAAPRHERLALVAQVRTEVGRLDAFQLLSPDRTAQEVRSAAAVGLDCKVDDEGCLGRLAVTLPVDLLVVPQLRRAKGHDDELRLDLFDSETGGRLHRVALPLPKAGPARLARIRELVELLLVPERRVGVLVVHAEGADTVLLDDGRSAPGPVARFEGVPAGTHHVTARRGEEVAAGDVDVVATTEVSLSLPLTPRPTPGGEPESEPAGLPMRLLVSGAVLAGTGAVVGLTSAAMGTYVLADLYVLNAATQSADYATRQVLLAGSFAAFGVGGIGALAVAAGVAWMSVSLVP